VSSPNTERLRELQGAEALAALLAGVMAARDGLPRRIPVFLKIAPDLGDAELGEIADVAREAGVAGIIATNTTLSREGLQSAARDEAGG
ncbi:MAG TPA: dihydroorotate dehydrogenase (quinone), partial [Roseovarius sp.]|nr:dihydroorotate dehydrogenase (quinone) [Roseovarius sp.]